jgi:hypothetical protein
MLKYISGHGRFVNMFLEPPGSFDKPAGMGSFVNY